MAAKNFIRIFVAALGVSALLAGCVSSHVMVGAPRAPISPDQVTIYMSPPAKYEQIAILDTSSQASWSFTAQGKTDKVIERLKAEAAKLGANGVLLQSVGNQQTGSFGGGFGSASASGHSALGFGLGSSAAIYQKSGSGIAIYVAPN